ncbi:MAG: cupin domain-containing protein [Synechococcus sp.]
MEAPALPLTASLLLQNLTEVADWQADISWQPFREGVDIHYLYRAGLEDESQASAALLRYQPGATVPPHVHSGYEHVFVLSGSQTDANGTYRSGSLVINPPLSQHSIVSHEGCIVLTIWEKPVQLCQ